VPQPLANALRDAQRNPKQEGCSDSKPEAAPAPLRKAIYNTRASLGFVQLRTPKFTCGAGLLNLHV
jgi:hypothetical protein